MAIEPYPLLATAREEMVSGISAPTATRTIPKRERGSPDRSFHRPATAEMVKEKKETHKKAIKNVKGYPALTQHTGKERDSESLQSLTER